MRSFDEHFLDLGGGKKIKYLANSNTGKPRLLMLHGVNIRSEYFSDFFPFLTDDYDIFAPDFRGHGLSFRSDEPYSLDNHAWDIGLFIERVMPGPLFMLGMSLGGRVGLIVATRQPERVKKLVVVDVGPDVNPAGLDRIIEAQSLLPESFDHLEDLRSFYLKAYQNVTPHYIDSIIKFSWRKNADGKMVKSYHKTIWNLGKESFIADAETLNGLLPQIDIPVLVLRGSHSDILTPEDAGRFVKRLKRGSLVEIPNTTHGLLLEEPARCANAIGQFLAP